jgi:hypothetical protein
LAHAPAAVGAHPLDARGRAVRANADSGRQIVKRYIVARSCDLEQLRTM